MAVEAVVEGAPERRRWLSILAKAPAKDVIAAWDSLAGPLTDGRHDGADRDNTRDAAGRSA